MSIVRDLTRKYKVTGDDDDEIGKGDYALTTDESGKFWGNAGAGGIFLAKNTGRYLLPYRSRQVNEPNTWGVWGGAIDDDESPEEAVKREIREETGFKGNYQLKLLHVYTKGNFKYSTYLIEVADEFEPVLNWETEKYSWFKLADFPKDRIHFGLKPIIPKLRF